METNMQISTLISKLNTSLVEFKKIELPRLLATANIHQLKFVKIETNKCAIRLSKNKTESSLIESFLKCFVSDNANVLDRIVQKCNLAVSDNIIKKNGLIQYVKTMMSDYDFVKFHESQAEQVVFRINDTLRLEKSDRVVRTLTTTLSTIKADAIDSLIYDYLAHCKHDELESSLYYFRHDVADSAVPISYYDQKCVMFEDFIELSNVAEHHGLEGSIFNLTSVSHSIQLAVEDHIEEWIEYKGLDNIKLVLEETTDYEEIVSKIKEI